VSLPTDEKILPPLWRFSIRIRHFAVSRGTKFLREKLTVKIPVVFVYPGLYLRDTEVLHFMLRGMHQKRKSALLRPTAAAIYG
jgi:hypothetical protein